MRSVKWPFAALALLAFVVGGALALRHQRAELLRTQIALARDEQRELAALRAENRRLAAQQVSAEELERLRADRMAVLRLRTEVDALRARTEQMERSLSATAQAPSATPQATAAQSESAPPALALTIGVGADGQLSWEERAFDLDALRRRLASLRRGDAVAIGLQMPESGKLTRTDELKANIDRLMNLAREFGLRMEVKFEHPGFQIQTSQPKG
jgi:hypothetical protein